MVLELVFVVAEVGFGGVELLAGIGYAFGFWRVGIGVREDTVFDKGDADVPEFGVYPVAPGFGEVLFEAVYWRG